MKAKEKVLIGLTKEEQKMKNKYNRLTKAELVELLMISNSNPKEKDAEIERLKVENERRVEQTTELLEEKDKEIARSKKATKYQLYKKMQIGRDKVVAIAETAQHLAEYVKDEQSIVVINNILANTELLIKELISCELWREDDYMPNLQLIGGEVAVVDLDPVIELDNDRLDPQHVMDKEAYSTMGLAVEEKKYCNTLLPGYQYSAKPDPEAGDSWCGTTVKNGVKYYTFKVLLNAKHLDEPIRYTWRIPEEYVATNFKMFAAVYNADTLLAAFAKWKETNHLVVKCIKAKSGYTYLRVDGSHYYALYHSGKEVK